MPGEPEKTIRERFGERPSALVPGEPGLFVLLCGFAIFTVIVLPAYLCTDHREGRLARDG